VIQNVTKNVTEGFKKAEELQQNDAFAPSGSLLLLIRFAVDYISCRRQLIGKSEISVAQHL
jgi:hypothetical protein